MELTERKQRILSSVVNNFVQYGEPVGSKTIADEIGVSSATIRNEMADLIQLGLLEQPYTSAGRVPSQLGYQQYVRGLDYPKLPSEESRNYYDSRLHENVYDTRRLLGCVPEILSDDLKLTAVASSKIGDSTRVKAVQFVQISRRTAMLILMSSAGTVSNRIFHCDYDLTVEILRMFFHIFNNKLSQVLISEITVAFIQSMAISFGELSLLSASPLMALLELAQETQKSEVLIRGEMNLLMYSELERSNVRYIVDFLDNQDMVNRLMSQAQKKITVLIGYETNEKALRDCSVVMERFYVKNIDVGKIAVIGTMRMNYEKVISAVDYLSKKVGEMLTALTAEI